MASNNLCYLSMNNIYIILTSGHTKKKKVEKLFSQPNIKNNNIQNTKPNMIAKQKELRHHSQLP